MFNDQKFENPKTVRYSSIIQDNQLIKELLLLKDKQSTDSTSTPTSTNRSSSLINTLRGSNNEEKLNNLWLKVQITINSIFDSSLDNRSAGRVAKGIRQVKFYLITDQIDVVSIFSDLSGPVTRSCSMGCLGNREERRSLSDAYDGKTCELCGSISDIARSVHCNVRSGNTRNLCKEINLSRIGHTA